MTQINAGGALHRQLAGMRDAGDLQEYQAHPVTSTSARTAYPLVYLHDASVTLAAWLRFVRSRLRTSQRGGLMAIRDRRGIVHALFAWRVDRDMRARRRLCVSDLIVAHLPGSQIDHAVLASADEVAAALGCQAVSIAKPLQPRLASPGETLAPSRGRPSSQASPWHH